MAQPTILRGAGEGGTGLGLAVHVKTGEYIEVTSHYDAERCWIPQGDPLRLLPYGKVVPSVPPPPLPPWFQIHEDIGAGKRRPTPARRPDPRLSNRQLKV